MKLSFLSPRLALIAAGVGLGMLARVMLGVPESDPQPKRTIERPINEADERVPELPIIKASDDQPVSGLVPPIQLPGQLPTGQASHFASANDDFDHDPTAIFHSHGNQVCASGCAVSNHPTEELTEARFWQLLDEYRLEPMDQTNNALEALLFFGPQTKKWIEAYGVGELDSTRSAFLWEQLKCKRVQVSLRVVDQDGNIRSWLDSSSVPFDRRHVFDMQTKDLQPLVTSGTVKRVGLNHAWVRL
ncbi:MAG: hypothetical protein AAFN77_05655 [Planctomycetota bacterium]